MIGGTNKLYHLPPSKIFRYEGVSYIIFNPRVHHSECLKSMWINRFILGIYVFVVYLVYDIYSTSSVCVISYYGFSHESLWNTNNCFYCLFSLYVLSCMFSTLNICIRILIICSILCYHLSLILYLAHHCLPHFTRTIRIELLFLIYFAVF